MSFCPRLLSTMHKKLAPRLVAKISVFDGVAYQTTQYKKHIYLGDPINICNVLSDQGCQEISLVFPQEPPSIAQVSRILSVCRAPVSIGGYGTDMSDIRRLMRSGAEKIILSDTIWRCPENIYRLTSELGSQAVSISLDYIVRESTRFLVTGPNRSSVVGELTPFLLQLDHLPVGEVILSCVTNDGLLVGLDYDILHQIDTTKPLLLSGGYDGTYTTLQKHSELDYSEAKLSGAITASSLFLYGENNAPLTCYPFPLRVT